MIKGEVYFCSGNLEKIIVTFYYEYDGKYILVENAPAEICMKCEEKIYSPQVIELGLFEFFYY